MSYLFDQTWQYERARLNKLELALDPFTHADIEKLGIRPGWRCLEVGAGGGSVAEWLAWRVGPTGRVVATDISTKFVETLRAPNLEVRQHDIVAHSLEEAAFDLVHSRAMLEHVKERDKAIDKMVSALRPGGWLMIEGADFRACVPMRPEHDDLFQRGWDLLHRDLEGRGFDGRFGRRAAWELRRRGLENVEFTGRIFEWGGSMPLTPFYIQTFDRLALDARREGDESAKLLDAFLEMVKDPEFRAMSHINCSVCGRRPETI